MIVGFTMNLLISFLCRQSLWFFLQFIVKVKNVWLKTNLNVAIFWDRRCTLFFPCAIPVQWLVGQPDKSTCMLWSFTMLLFLGKLQRGNIFWLCTSFFNDILHDCTTAENKKSWWFSLYNNAKLLAGLKILLSKLYWNIITLHFMDSKHANVLLIIES
jgi:hypothetical protein